MKKRTGTEQTVRQIIEEYIIDCQSRGLSDRTVKDYHKELVKYFGDLRKLSVDDYRTLQTDLTNKNISISSINHFLRTAKTFINWCIEKGYCEYRDLFQEE